MTVFFFLTDDIYPTGRVHTEQNSYCLADWRVLKEGKLVRFPTADEILSWRHDFPTSSFSARPCRVRTEESDSYVHGCKRVGPKRGLACAAFLVDRKLNGHLAFFSYKMRSPLRCLAGHVLRRYNLSNMTHYPSPLYQGKVGLILRLLAYYQSM